jgi:cytochrome o ubiquinol oxidase subunit 1
VWLHHFFTMGAGADVNAFFGIMTMVIAVPTGVKVFNWLFTMYRGRVRFTTPMLWFLGFVVTFTIGGAAGVLMAVPAVDFQIHNSLFLVAHFHTMIIGGVLFGAFAGLTYWFPKFTGFRLNEFLGKCAFWCWLLGFIVAFTPLYILGLMGATRRLDHYDPSMGWQWLFIVAGLGVLLILLGVGFQVLQIVYSIWDHKKHPKPAESDPWNARTLEWATTSPPQVYNFATIPNADKRDAFWESKQSKTAITKVYEDIELPKNTPLGMFIAAGAFVVGFGIVWHIWWMAIAGLVFSIVCMLVRFSDDQTDTVLTASEVEKMEAAL